MKVGDRVKYTPRDGFLQLEHAIGAEGTVKKLFTSGVGPAAIILTPVGVITVFVENLTVIKSKENGTGPKETEDDRTAFLNDWSLQDWEADEDRREEP